MANCYVPGYTTEQMEQHLLNKKILDMTDMSTGQRAATLRQINQLVSTQAVSADQLTQKTRDALGIESDGVVDRYVLNSTLALIAGRRTSDLAAAKFGKNRSKEEIKKISEQLDTVIKSEGGTKFHEGSQWLLESYIENDTSGKVFKLSELDGKKPSLVKEAHIQEHLGLNNKQFETFKRGIKEVFNLIVETQRKINPAEKVAILPEQVIINPLNDVGSTVDVLALFSDGTHANLDFKTIRPSDLDVSSDFKILTEDFIPEARVQSFSDQLTQSNETMLNIYNSKGSRLSRIVPIHVRYKKLPKADRVTGATLTRDIEYLGVGQKSDPMLRHIPVGELVTLLGDRRLVEKLNQKIGTLSVLNNNRRLELLKTPYLLPGTKSEINPKYIELKRSIERTRKVMNSLIIDQDFVALQEDFKAVLGRVKDSNLFAEDINTQNEEINGEVNPYFISLENVRDMLHEVEAYKGVIDASKFLTQELDLGSSEKTQDYLNSVSNMSSEAEILIQRLQGVLTDRTVTPQQEAAFDNITKLNVWEKYARSLREQVPMPFRLLSRKLDTALNTKRLRLQKMYDDSVEWRKTLEQYGRQNGMSVSRIFDMMINNETENLHSKFSKEFYEALKLAQENKDEIWLRKHLVKKADAQKLFERNIEIHKKSVPGEKDYELRRWKDRNSPDALLYHDKLWFLYWEPAERSENFSDGYKTIAQHKPILEFYNYFTETMSELNDLLGLGRNEHIPKNFLAHIRGKVVEQVTQGTFGIKQLQESIQSLWQLRVDDPNLGDLNIEEGKRDPHTNEPKLSVPRYFINPIRDSKGQIKKGLKLRDLTKSLYIYADMALNYHLLETVVEPHAEAIRDIMVMKGLQDTTESGQKKKLSSGVFAKIFSERSDVMALYDQLVNYHLYGIKIQDVDKKTAKKLSTLKSIHGKIELALSPLLWTGNLGQIVSNAYFEGHNGYFYKKQTMFETQAEAVGIKGKKAKDLYNAASHLFEFSPGYVHVKEKNMSASKLSRILDTDTLFWGMRKSEQVINNNIGISILKTHTIDKHRNITRMATAPEGSKSIYDMMYFDKNGNFRIDGLIDSEGNVTDIDLYTRIRNTAIGVARTVKGQLNQEDMPGIYMHFLGNAGMGFKSWLPGMLDARFTGIRYNPLTNTIVEGKYSALKTDLAKEDKAMMQWIGNVVVPTLLRFGLHIATFGGKQYKVNQQRARHLFNQYLEQHIGDPDIQKMTFEDYMDYKQGQIRSLAAELTVILAMVGFVMAMRADWDGDGEPLWKETYSTRTLFRMINRARRETAFFISPGDWTGMLRFPAPVIGLGVDTYKAVTSLAVGLQEFVTGAEPDPRRKRSRLYPVQRMIPGNKFLMMLESDEVSKLREI